MKTNIMSRLSVSSSDHLSLKILLILVCWIQPTPAPVPRCSPFIIINKLAEYSNILSDSNPYFPVPPCEYGGPKEAIKAGDYRAVFVLAEPLKIPRHNLYEFVWLLRTGAPRWFRMLTGSEEFVEDRRILKEGHSRHHTPYVRTNQIGTYTHRNPLIIDKKPLFNYVVKKNLGQFFRNGPDKYPNKHYTFQGKSIPSRGHGPHGGGYGHYYRRDNKQPAYRHRPRYSPYWPNRSSKDIREDHSYKLSANDAISNDAIAHSAVDHEITKDAGDFDIVPYENLRQGKSFYSFTSDANQEDSSDTISHRKYESGFVPSSWPD